MTHPEVWRGREAHAKVQEGSASPPGGPGGVRRPTQRFGRPTLRFGRGREAHPEVREGSGSRPRGQGGVGRPTRRCGRGRQAH